MMQILCYGELLCDMTGTGDRTFLMNAGGAPANCAVAAKKAGAPEVGMAAKVGKDLFGDYLVKTLTEAGVNAENVTVDGAGHTTLAFVTLTAGERSFSFYRLSDREITTAEAEALSYPEKGIFHFGSLSLTDEPILSATLRAVERAKARGNLVSFDVNYRANLWTEAGAAKDRILSLLPSCDLLKISEEEAAFLTGEFDPFRAAKTLQRAYGVPLVVLTLGAEGSAAITEDFIAKAAAFSAKVVDTTGAGDCFYGSFLAEIAKRGGISDLKEKEAGEILRFCNMAGGAAVEGYGAIPSYLSREEILKRWQK